MCPYKQATRLSVRHSPLYESLELLGENVGAVHHEPNVPWSRVEALTVQDRTLEHIGEFGARTQEAGPYKVHHAPEKPNSTYVMLR